MKFILRLVPKITLITGLLPALLSILLVLSCATQNAPFISPGQIDLERAKGFQQAGRYELAIEHYMVIKNKYPLSSEAVIAELELAETFYLQRSFVEARAGFETFKDLHPRHKKVDFAAFRIAMTYYRQIPSTNDRDLSSAANTIVEFEKFIKNFPKSKYVSGAKEKIQESKKRLAEKEYTIASFYLKTKHYEAAAGRFRDTLKKHRGLGFNEKALFHLGVCYYKMKDEKLARETLELFLRRHADSEYKNKAEKMLKEL